MSPGRAASAAAATASAGSRSPRKRWSRSPRPPSPRTDVARTFLLLGSGEFEPWTHDVESRVLAEASGDGSVVILPTASAPDGDAVFDRWAKMGLDHYA